MTQQDISVVKWLKEDGDSTDKGQGVVTIETAKVTYEIEAPAAGRIFRIKKVGDKVKIGEALGVVADSRQEFEGYKGGLPSEADGRADLVFDDTAEEGGVRLTFEDEPERLLRSLRSKELIKCRIAHRCFDSFLYG